MSWNRSHVCAKQADSSGGKDGREKGQKGVRLRPSDVGGLQSLKQRRPELGRGKPGRMGQAALAKRPCSTSGPF